MTGVLWTSLVWVDDVEPETAIAVAGSKMGRLADLYRAGVQVPQGFAVTVDAYRRHCAESGLDARIDEVLAGRDPDDVDAASATIRELFAATPMSDALTATDRGLRGAVPAVRGRQRAHRGALLGHRRGRRGRVLRRDLRHLPRGLRPAAGAGRDPGLLGSLFTARALAYRLRKGISHHDMPIAVGVIELIHARASGVAFSVHPVTGKPDRVVIETSWGWGEAIVQGLVDPDHIEVGKSDGRVLKYDVAHKKVVSAFDFADGRVTEIDMPAKLADRRVLDDEQIAAVTAAVTAIEEHYGYPVDVDG